MATSSERLRRISSSKKKLARPKRRDERARPERPRRAEAPDPKPKSQGLGLGALALLAVGAIAAMFVFAFANDRHQRDVGASAVDRWTDIDAADRGFARWLAEKNHDLAANAAGEALGRVTERGRSSARFDVSDAQYESMLHAMVARCLQNRVYMNDYAWDVLEKNPGDRAAAEEARRWARRACDLSADDPPKDRAERLDTLARATFECGDASLAIDLQREAVKLTPEGAGMRERLRRYGG